MTRFIRVMGMVLALLGTMLALPQRSTAKCAEASLDLVCPELKDAFAPQNPKAGEEVVVTAIWVDQRTNEPVNDAQWLDRRGKPAYLWLWDHQPSDLESIAFVEGTAGNVQLPQSLVLLQWNAADRAYQGSFVVSDPGEWYWMLGTVVPDELSADLGADFDYVGPIRSLEISSPSQPFIEFPPLTVRTAFIAGGILTFILLWLVRNITGRISKRDPFTR